MDKSTQSEPSDFTSHTGRMDTLQWAGEHATARYERETMRALEQEEREARRERYPAFLDELIEAIRHLQVMAEARAEIEGQVEVEAQAEVEGSGAEGFDGAGETKMEESTHASDEQAPVLTLSGSCVRSSRRARRDLAGSVDSKAKLTNDSVLLDKKAAVSEPKVNVTEEEEVEESDQSYAMMALVHDDDCWVKPDRRTDPWCSCQMVIEPSNYS